MRGLLIRDSDFKIINSSCSDLIKKLTISHVSFIGKDKYVKNLPLYKKITTAQGIFWLVSRFVDLESILLVSSIKITKKNKILAGKDIYPIKFSPCIDLYENQQKAMDFLMRNIYSEKKIKQGSAACIFVLDTGLGKTYIGGALIELSKKKTLIIVPKSSPIKEWTDMLEQNFPELDIGQYHSKAPKTDGDIVIMTIDSALNDKFTWISKQDKKSVKTSLSYNQYFQQFGTVIFDEIHNYTTSKRHEIFWRTNFQYSIGLTATPDERADGMDPVASAHVGKIIRAIEIPGFEVEEIKWKGNVKAIRYNGPPEYTIKYTNKKNWVSTKKMCDQFIADPYRNKLLLEEIKKLYREGKYIFVFSERRDYLLTLQEKLAEQNLESGEMQTLMGGATYEEDLQARTNAKIILITYGYGIEGISIPRMDAIVFATPRRRKMRQTIGRILRRSGNPSITRQIIDIIDENTTLKSQFNTRKQVYTEKDFPIQESSVDFILYA
jgi:superfamily II DNA or RNA helicase